jgi:proline iminopeptidase
MNRFLFALIVGILLHACSAEPVGEATSDYFDNSGRSDVLSGGVRLIPVETPSGTFRVWTKRVGNNPTQKVLLLHGGPGATHEYLEAFDSYFPGAGIEYYYYDQLGSAYSDQPDSPELWDVPRFVDEVEQVRLALGLKHQENLKGLIVSNMMASIPAYNQYAQDVLMPAMDADVLAEIQSLEQAEDYGNPRYMELLIEHHYEDHILRMPVEEWPDPVNRAFARLNHEIYIPLQGPSELGASGKLVNWDRTDVLSEIKVPTLVIGAEHDSTFPNGRYLYCPDGSHFALYDDQATYFEGLINFIGDVDGGRF